MDAGRRARAWLASDAATELPPALRAPLEAALADPAPETAVTLPHGTVVCSLGGRRVLEVDRRGAAVGMLVWNEHGLALASVRLPDSSWVTIEPRGTTDAPWGPSDRLWHCPRPCRLDADAVPLSVFVALDYSTITTIPPLAEPPRLPPGAGTAVLNLVASLARDQRRARLVYAGPYPTEALFLALLESFRYEPPTDDPLAAFLRAALAWCPAPHERRFERPAVYVQMRDRVEKVVWERRTYYRADWQSVRRHAPRRVRDDDDGVVCGLWALGEPVEEHIRLDTAGGLRGIVAPPAPRTPPRTLPREVVRGVVERIAADSVAALAPYVRVAGEALTIERGPVDRDLARVDGDAARVSHRLLEVGADRLRRCADDGARVVIGAALLHEIAGLLGDEMRARAQAILAARPRAEQESALGLADDPQASSGARHVRRAIEALVADLAGAPRGPDSGP